MSQKLSAITCHSFGKHRANHRAAQTATLLLVIHEQLQTLSANGFDIAKPAAVASNTEHVHRQL